MGLLTDRINNKLKKSNLINDHALNREPVPFIIQVIMDVLLSRSEFLAATDSLIPSIFNAYFTTNYVASV